MQELVLRLLLNRSVANTSKLQESEVFVRFAFNNIPKLFLFVDAETAGIHYLSPAKIDQHLQILKPIRISLLIPQTTLGPP